MFIRVCKSPFLFLPFTIFSFLNFFPRTNIHPPLSFLSTCMCRTDLLPLKIRFLIKLINAQLIRYIVYFVYHIRCAIHRHFSSVACCLQVIPTSEKSQFVTAVFTFTIVINFAFHVLQNKQLLLWWSPPEQSSKGIYSSSAARWTPFRFSSQSFCGHSHYWT